MLMTIIMVNYMHKVKIQINSMILITHFIQFFFLQVVLCTRLNPCLKIDEGRLFIIRTKGMYKQLYVYGLALGYEQFATIVERIQTYQLI